MSEQINFDTQREGWDGGRERENAHARAREGSREQERESGRARERPCVTLHGGHMGTLTRGGPQGPNSWEEGEEGLRRKEEGGCNQSWRTTNRFTQRAEAHFS